jgi:hypothetical protein
LLCLPLPPHTGVSSGTELGPNMVFCTLPVCRTCGSRLRGKLSWPPSRKLWRRARVRCSGRWLPWRRGMQMWLRGRTLQRTRRLSWGAESKRWPRGRRRCSRQVLSMALLVPPCSSLFLLVPLARDGQLGRDLWPLQLSSRGSERWQGGVRRGQALPQLLGVPVLQPCGC